MTMSDEKMWGAEPFWGLGYEWDPDWVLTERQKELRATLIGLCEQELRDNAKRSDDELLFPRRNLELLGEHGFLALTVPEEYGGLGENHVAYSMVCETIARYGCASTAMCYVMHIGAVNAIMLRATDALIDKYIRPLNSGKIGTLSYSDPETGSHFWYPVSSGAEATAFARKRPGRRRAASPTSTSCRRRAPTSRATTICRSS
jgi:alkylation response protein AidB-like acyl-CoA dehydrogenase